VAAPILAGERYEGRPIYYSDVIVRSDSEVTSFDELRGRTWAYNEVDSQSGFGVVRGHLARLGESNGFFGRVVEAGFHDTAMRLVAEGAVDAAAIDSQVLAIARRDEPDLGGRLRAIDALGPSTIQPVVAASSLASDLRDGMREALVGLAADPRATEPFARGLLAGFVPVTDGRYDDIRRMEREAEAAGLTGLGTKAESLPRG
jgi:phosphonate transport system substrate-binding protein